MALLLQQTKMLAISMVQIGGPLFLLKLWRNLIATCLEDFLVAEALLSFFLPDTAFLLVTDHCLRTTALDKT